MMVGSPEAFNNNNSNNSNNHSRGTWSSEQKENSVCDLALYLACHGLATWHKNKWRQPRVRRAQQALQLALQQYRCKTKPTSRNYSKVWRAFSRILSPGALSLRLLHCT